MLLYSEAGKADAEKADLDAAAAHGSNVARLMTSDTNPYAALCHTAVERMMEGVQEQQGSAAQ